MVANTPVIKIRLLLWRELVIDLRQRGRNYRESGAFLLGATGANDGKIVDFVCFDDLDPAALQQGVIMFHAAGWTALWRICAEKKLEVLADVHTHPTADVRQSLIDKRNPMIPVKNHLALILPRYGNTSTWTLSGVGLYVFKGSGRWESFDPGSSSAPMQLSLW